MLISMESVSAADCWSEETLKKQSFGKKMEEMKSCISKCINHHLTKVIPTSSKLIDSIKCTDCVTFIIMIKLIIIIKIISPLLTVHCRLTEIFQVLNDELPVRVIMTKWHFEIKLFVHIACWRASAKHDWQRWKKALNCLFFKCIWDFLSFGKTCTDSTKVSDDALRFLQFSDSGRKLNSTLKWPYWPMH